MLEEGLYQPGDGSVWEAGTFELGGTGSFQNVEFAQNFAAPPHLILTVQTDNDAPAVAVVAREVTATGFQTALLKQESLSGDHGAETVGYLAVYQPSGQGILSLDGVPVAYALEQKQIGSRFRPVRGQALKLQEESSLDGETAHAEESVVVLDLGGDLFAQQVSSNETDTTALRRDNRDSDADGMVDGWEIDFAFNPNSAADATLDPDGDNLLNLTEYLRGSDPTQFDTVLPDRLGIFRDGVWHLDSNLDGTADFTFSYGASTDTPLVGDWDGDGIDTPGVKRGNTYYLRNSNTAGVADVAFIYGAVDDVPLVGDWDGDGIDSIGLKRGNIYHLRNSNTAGIADVSFEYEDASDTPIAGDWDGDGVDTIGVKRGAYYHLRNSNTEGGHDLVFQFGDSTDTPITGDWNGDGIDTVGVKRSNNYYLRNSNSSGVADLSLIYGSSTDLPLAGAW